MHLPSNGTKTVIIDRTIDVCGNLKRKLKKGDDLFRALFAAFTTKTNITSYCPILPGVYGYDKFQLDFDKFPPQLSSVKYIYTFTGSWYSMMKDKSRRKPVKVDFLSTNLCYHFEK